jgi:hypothetical protein
VLRWVMMRHVNSSTSIRSIIEFKRQPIVSLQHG